MPATLSQLVQRFKDHPPPSSSDVDRIRRALVGDVPDLLRRFVQAFVPRTAAELFEDWFPWTRDQRLATDPSVPDAERLAALSRLVAPIRWALNPAWGGRDERAWRVLLDRAKAEQRSIAAIKQELLTEAALLVLDDLARFRRIRIGRGAGSYYLRDDDNSPPHVRPLDLPYSADLEVTGGAQSLFAESPYLYWLHREVRRTAQALLLDEPYPPPDRADEDAWEQQPALFGDSVGSMADADADPLVALLRGEAVRADNARLANALVHATPRQQQLLSLIAAGAIPAQAAREIGIAASTARVQLKRLRDKANTV